MASQQVVPTGQSVTVGIELEFLAQFRHARVAYRDIARGLRENTTLPLVVGCLHASRLTCTACDDIPESDRHELRLTLSPHTFIVYQRHLDDQDGWVNKKFDPLKYFTIKFEGLINQVAGSTEPWQGVEITTAVMSNTEVTQGLPRVVGLIDGLKSIDAKIAINNDCGMHVHLGYTDGLTLLKAKRVVSLVCLLEAPLLLPLLSPQRKDGRWSLKISEDSYIYGQVHEPQLEPYDKDVHEVFGAQIPAFDNFHDNRWNSNNGTKLYSALCRLWDIESLPNLGWFLCDSMGIRSGLAVCTRKPDGCRFDQSHHQTSPSTVEFRYMQMSFDTDLVNNWVSILSALMKIGDTSGDEYVEEYNNTFATLLGVISEAEANDDNNVWENILKTLGLAEQIPF